MFSFGFILRNYEKPEKISLNKPALYLKKLLIQFFMHNVHIQHSFVLPP